MPIVVQCPSCNRKLRVPDDLLGRLVKCPTCSQTFTAAEEGTAPAATRPPVEQPPPWDQPPEEERVPKSSSVRRRPPEPAQEDLGPAEDYGDEPRRRPLRRDLQPHRGTLILVLGILSLASSLLMGCCSLLSPLFGTPFLLAGLALGITSWVLGQGDLRKMNANLMDPDGRGSTQGGWICGIIGTVLSGLGVLCIIGLLLFIGTVGLAGGFSK
jgi:predicted Zn finger-like uncharacterized protein